MSDTFLSALTAAGGNSRAARSLRARLQWRDRKGKWIEMGRGVKFKVRGADGAPRSVIGSFVGALDDKTGQVYVSNDPNGLKDGFYDVSSRNAEEFAATLSDSDLAEGGVAPKSTAEVGERAAEDIPDITEMVPKDAPEGWKAIPGTFQGKKVIETEDGDFRIHFGGKDERVLLEDHRAAPGKAVPQRSVAEAFKKVNDVDVQREESGDEAYKGLGSEEEIRAKVEGMSRDDKIDQIKFAERQMANERVSPDQKQRAIVSMNKLKKELEDAGEPYDPEGNDTDEAFEARKAAPQAAEAPAEKKPLAGTEDIDVSTFDVAPEGFLVPTGKQTNDISPEGLANFMTAEKETLGKGGARLVIDKDAGTAEIANSADTLDNAKAQAGGLGTDRVLDLAAGKEVSVSEGAVDPNSPDVNPNLEGDTSPEAPNAEDRSTDAVESQPAQPGANAPASSEHNGEAERPAEPSPEPDAAGGDSGDGGADRPAAPAGADGDEAGSSPDGADTPESDASEGSGEGGSAAPGSVEDLKKRRKKVQAALDNTGDPKDIIALNEQADELDTRIDALSNDGPEGPRDDAQPDWDDLTPAEQEAERKDARRSAFDEAREPAEAPSNAELLDGEERLSELEAQMEELDAKLEKQQQIQQNATDALESGNFPGEGDEATYWEDAFDNAQTEIDDLTQKLDDLQREFDQSQNADAIREEGVDMAEADLREGVGEVAPEEPSLAEKLDAAWAKTDPFPDDWPSKRERAALRILRDAEKNGDLEKGVARLSDEEKAALPDDIAEAVGIRTPESTTGVDWQARVREKGGISITPDLQSEPTEGYMVARPGFNQEIPQADFFDPEKGPKIVADWIAKNQAELDKPGGHIGIWWDKDNKEVVLDVSENILDADEARRLGTERNQQSVWDVVAEDEIPTGGTGDRQTAPEREAYQEPGDAAAAAAAREEIDKIDAAIEAELALAEQTAGDPKEQAGHLSRIRTLERQRKIQENALNRALGNAPMDFNKDLGWNMRDRDNRGELPQAPEAAPEAAEVEQSEGPAAVLDTALDTRPAPEVEHEGIYPSELSVGDYIEHPETGNLVKITNISIERDDDEGATKFTISYESRNETEEAENEAAGLAEVWSSERINTYKGWDAPEASAPEDPSDPAPRAPRTPYEPSMGAATGSAREIFENADSPAQALENLRNGDTYVLDFETTGLEMPSDSAGERTHNRPVQIAIIHMRNGEEVDRFTTYMNPEEPLGEWSRGLKQPDGSPVTDEFLAGQPTIGEVMQQAKDFMGDNPIVLGQNVKFDTEILERESKANGIDIPLGGTLDSKELADILLPKTHPTRLNDKGEPDRVGRKLTEIVDFLNEDEIPVSVGNAHEAAADSEMAYGAFEGILKRADRDGQSIDGVLDESKNESNWERYAQQYDRYIQDLYDYFDQIGVDGDDRKERIEAAIGRMSPDAVARRQGVERPRNSFDEPEVAERTPADLQELNEKDISDKLDGIAELGGVMDENYTPDRRYLDEYREGPAETAADNYDQAEEDIASLVQEMLEILDDIDAFDAANPPQDRDDADSRFHPAWVDTAVADMIGDKVPKELRDRLQARADRLRADRDQFDREEEENALYISALQKTLEGRAADITPEEQEVLDDIEAARQVAAARPIEERLAEAQAAFDKRDQDYQQLLVRGDYTDEELDTADTLRDWAKQDLDAVLEEQSHIEGDREQREDEERQQREHEAGWDEYEAQLERERAEYEDAGQMSERDIMGDRISTFAETRQAEIDANHAEQDARPAGTTATVTHRVAGSLRGSETWTKNADGKWENSKGETVDYLPFTPQTGRMINGGGTSVSYSEPRGGAAQTAKVNSDIEKRDEIEAQVADGEGTGGLYDKGEDPDNTAPGHSNQVDAAKAKLQGKEVSDEDRAEIEQALNSDALSDQQLSRVMAEIDSKPNRSNTITMPRPETEQPEHMSTADLDIVNAERDDPNFVFDEDLTWRKVKEEYPDHVELGNGDLLLDTYTATSGSGKNQVSKRYDVIVRRTKRNRFMVYVMETDQFGNRRAKRVGKSEWHAYETLEKRIQIARKKSSGKRPSSFFSNNRETPTENLGTQGFPEDDFLGDIGNPDAPLPSTGDAQYDALLAVVAQHIRDGDADIHGIEEHLQQIDPGANAIKTIMQAVIGRAQDLYRPDGTNPWQTYDGDTAEIGQEYDWTDWHEQLDWWLPDGSPNPNRRPNPTYGEVHRVRVMGYVKENTDGKGHTYGDHVWVQVYDPNTGTWSNWTKRSAQTLRLADPDSPVGQPFFSKREEWRTSPEALARRFRVPNATADDPVQTQERPRRDLPQSRRLQFTSRGNLAGHSNIPVPTSQAEIAGLLTNKQVLPSIQPASEARPGMMIVRMDDDGNQWVDSIIRVENLGDGSYRIHAARPDGKGYANVDSFVVPGDADIAFFSAPAIQPPKKPAPSNARRGELVEFDYNGIPTQGVVAFDDSEGNLTVVGPGNVVIDILESDIEPVENPEVSTQERQDILDSLESYDLPEYIEEMIQSGLLSPGLTREIYERIDQEIRSFPAGSSIGKFIDRILGMLGVPKSVRSDIRNKFNG